MGLYIYCKHSDKSISWGYSTLHFVRDLAYLACGVPFEVSRLTRAFYNSDIFGNSYLWNSDKPPKISSGDLQNLAVAGFHFAQLLWHSDCGGTYTSRGKIFKDNDLSTGNIHKLEEELECLLIYYTADKVKELEVDEMLIDRLKELYELVADEATYKRPVVYFG